MATEGCSQHEIARTLGISQPAVSQILQRVDDRWASENQNRLARHKGELVRKLAYIHREALHAWEQSKAQRTRRRQRKTEGGETAGAGTVAELVVEDSHGDPRHLDTARRALADQARVLGVAGPVSTPVRAAIEECPVTFTLKLDGPRTPPNAIRERLATRDQPEEE
jgi:hypothetical protein